VKLFKNRRNRGAALVEYALLVAGVALVTAAAVSIFGHKTNDMVAAVATVLPGAHTDDNGPIVSGKLIETTPGGVATPISLDIGTASTGILGNSGTTRLGGNLGVPLENLVVEPN
jgi:Flp pilus assembly pilin Flp